MTKCIVCGSSKLRQLIFFEKYPLCIGVLPPKLFRKIGSYPLSIKECSVCGHIQQAQTCVKRNDVYKNEHSELISSVPTPSETGINKEAQRSLDFFVGCNIPKGKVLDIGCYDGYFLSLIKRKGYEVQGIEPNPASEIAKQKYGIPIIKDYFSNKYYKKNSFDIIVLRNILEHIQEVDNFIKNVTRVLKPGGYIFIEVPNTTFLLRKGIASIFFHQHFSYFSLNVMRHLLARHSLKLIKFKRGYFMYLLAKKREKRKINIGKIKNENLKATIDTRNYFTIWKKKINDLNRILKDKNKIGIFAAGGETTDLIRMLDEKFRKKIKFVYDNNKLKHGNLLAELPIAVRDPKSIRQDNADAIIVSTNLFQAEIVKQLKAMNTPGFKIITLYPKVGYA